MSDNVFGQKIGWDRTKIDEITFSVGKKIYDLANGLTHDQFVTAMKLALEDVEANFTLSVPPVQK